MFPHDIAKEIEANTNFILPRGSRLSRKATTQYRKKSEKEAASRREVMLVEPQKKSELKQMNKNFLFSDSPRVTTYAYDDNDNLSDYYPPTSTTGGAGVGGVVATRPESKRRPSPNKRTLQRNFSPQQQHRSLKLKDYKPPHRQRRPITSVQPSTNTRLVSPTPLESQYVGAVQAATNLLRNTLVDTVVSQLKSAAATNDDSTK